jgi:prefoldin subunit 5
LINHSDTLNELENKIQIFQNQLDSLRQRVLHLEDQTKNFKDVSKYLLSSQLNELQATKRIKQSDWILDP